MSAFGSRKPFSLFIEFGESTLNVLAETGGIEVPIERLETGGLSERCKDEITSGIRGFLAHQNPGTRTRAICAIGARGVSLRRLTLPPSGKEEVPRLIHLQVETEFPLPPDELAWGYQLLGATEPNGDGARGPREVLVAALKKEVIEEYAAVLADCGVKVVFTVAALARGSSLLQRPACFSMLDIGAEQSELVLVENGAVVSMHVLSLGTEKFRRVFDRGAPGNREVPVSAGFGGDSGDGQNSGDSSETLVRMEARRISSLTGESPAGRKLFVSGSSANLAGLTSELQGAFNGVVECERTDFSSGRGRSAATVGLMKAFANGATEPILSLETRETPDGNRLAGRKRWKWIAIAAALAVCSLSFRYIEAYARKPELSRRLAEVTTEKNALPEIDRELAFMRHLHTNRAPFLEIIAALAEASPRGTRFETLSLNRRGELSLRGTMQNSQQATEVRTKMIKSGMFSSVSVEEQNPDQNRQTVAVRITARWSTVSPGVRPAMIAASGDKQSPEQEGSKQ